MNLMNVRNDYAEVPLTIEEDLNKEHTTWAHGKCVKMDEGRWMTYFVMHKKETRTEFHESESVEKEICLAIPVRVKKGEGTKALHEAAKTDEVYVAVLPLFEKDNVEIMRSELIERIMIHDKSKAVNNFKINGVDLWLDLQSRSGLGLRFKAEKDAGLTRTTLWNDGTRFDLVIDDATQMLFDLEIYASQCYDNTQKHINAAASMVKDFEKYDYTVGYPEQLNFNS